MNELTTQEFSLAASNFEEALKIATIISKTDFCPKQFQGKPETVLIAIQYGKEVGLKPLQSLQNIGVINGKPTLYGDGLLAVVKNHPDYEWIKETCENGVARCEVKRKGEPEVVVTFSEAEAKKAGLWGKQGPWSQYPNRMLQMRARGFAIRDAFPDALKGLISSEEAQDYVVKESKKIDNIDNEIRDAGYQTIEATVIPDDMPDEESNLVYTNPNPFGSVRQNSKEDFASSNSLHELYTLIAAHGIGNDITDKWIKAAKVTMLEELTEEQVNKAIEWINKKYSDRED